jgi:acetyltransferase-like isoleucine patch superfamily enzyme
MISKGIPVINVKKSGKFVIGDDLTINNGRYYNQIGRQQPCYFIVGAKAVLTIGNNVGISSTTIVCMNNISIADNVKIGGNVVIYDTDFHSVHVHERVAMIEDASVIKTVPVCIKKNVFIGAHTTILKGVTIGENSIIGAGCVVAKDIPDNEVWVGNPAKFIKKV